MTVAKERERKPDEEGTFYQVSIWFVWKAKKPWEKDLGSTDKLGTCIKIYGTQRKHDFRGRLGIMSKRRWRRRGGGSVSGKSHNWGDSPDLIDKISSSRCICCWRWKGKEFTVAINWWKESEARQLFLGFQGHPEVVSGFDRSLHMMQLDLLIEGPAWQIWDWGCVGGGYARMLEFRCRLRMNTTGSEPPSLA